jgi:hypothetical protein
MDAERVPLLDGPLCLLGQDGVVLLAQLEEAQVELVLQQLLVLLIVDRAQLLDDGRLVLRDTLRGLGLCSPADNLANLTRLRPARTRAPLT